MKHQVDNLTIAFQFHKANRSLESFNNVNHALTTSTKGSASARQFLPKLSSTTHNRKDGKKLKPRCVPTSLMTIDHSARLAQAAHQVQQQQYRAKTFAHSSSAVDEDNPYPPIKTGLQAYTHPPRKLRPPGQHARTQSE